MSELERVSSLVPRVETPNAQSVEVGVEQESSHSEMVQQAPSNGAPSTPAPVAQPKSVAVPVANDPRVKILKDIEAILSDGLQDVYKGLSDDRKKIFRQKGEAAANAIAEMVIQGKAKIKEIWKLLKDWLGSLPGMNKYFLEQEIKIKTDRVMVFAEQTHS